jgi:hypothetical protein
VLGSRALLRGDLDEIARVVAASYAVHQAVIALQDDSLSSRAG